MEKILNLNRDPEATAQEEILNTTGRSNKPTLLFAAAEVSSKEVQFKDLKSKFSSVCSKSKAAEVQFCLIQSASIADLANTIVSFSHNSDREIKMTIIDDLKERCDAIEDALNKKIEDLNKAVKPTVEGTKSTDSRIERCIQSVDSKWNEFEVAYHALKGKLVPNAQNPLDCPVASQKTRFDALYRSQQDAIMNAYDELDERKEKAEREKRNQDDAAKIDEENESKKRKINSLIGLHKERIKKSFKVYKILSFAQFWSDARSRESKHPRGYCSFIQSFNGSPSRSSVRRGY